MSANDVIPSPEERAITARKQWTPSQREIGRIEFDGDNAGLYSDIVICVEGDAVVIDYGGPLDKAKRDKFMRLYFEAERQAEAGS